MDVMRRFTFAAGLAALTLGLGACGSGYGGSTPTGPTADGTLPNGAIVINIVAENGDRSFSPNPATVPAGSTVVWHNVDGLTHRVLLNDRGLDTGNIAPGAYSQPMTLAAPGPYHCTIHPDMIGVAQSVQTSAGTTDPY
jgi:plastocyanin